jgi:branched-chain amino acid transport system ATP-binding protein
MSELLRVEALEAAYGSVRALRGVDLEVRSGELVALVGSNGAGKSTLLRAVMGQVRVWRGTIRYRSDDLASLATHARVARGLALVPEGRRLFPSLSVSENLKIGAHAGRPGEWTLERVVELFPLLARLLSRPADVLSGGEKQAVAIGRALMSNPDVLLLDEVSLGLAPIVVRDLYAAIPGIKAAGTTVVIVEQDVSLALDIADHVYCMLEGRVSLSGTPSMLTHTAVTDAYFGVRA